MPYYLTVWVDGACRGNGKSWAQGGCGVAVEQRSGRLLGYSFPLPSHPTPTNQRAELQAMIHGLELAIEKRNALDLDPYLILTMKSDSRYAVDCMNVWINNWRQNGWVNSKGYEVVNRDLITRIDDLWDEIIDGAGSGKVVFRWIPREQNSFADKLANDALDEGSE